MKIQIRRIGHVRDEYNHSMIDTRFMEGTVDAIRPGIELEIAFNRMGYGTWHTTKVERVEYLEGGMHVYTKNSIYAVKKGWK